MYSVLSFIAFFLHLFQTKCEWCDGVGYIYCYCPLIKVINNGPQGHKRPKKVEGRNVNAWKHPLHQGQGGARGEDRRKKKESTSCGNYEYLDSWLSLFSPFKLWANFIKWKSTCKKNYLILETLFMGLSLLLLYDTYDLGCNRLCIGRSFLINISLLPPIIYIYIYIYISLLHKKKKKKKNLLGVGYDVFCSP